MRLYFQAQGEGRPLVILHGLLGSLDNWRSMAKRLAARRRVYSVDLRNHGRSPHSAVMDYAVMAQDVRELCAAEDIREPAVLGHSMGGKVAMQFAGQYPEQIERLLVVDIAPKAYPPAHRPLLSAMRTIDPRRYRSFGEIGDALAPAVADPAVRQFALKNLTRDTGGGLRWRIGLDEISDNYNLLTQSIDVPVPFSRPACFIRGENSGFVENQDLASIRRGFPYAEIKTIRGAGHWLHIDAPDEFYAVAARFLAD